jgi:hypothetical protein
MIVTCINHLIAALGEPPTATEMEMPSRDLLRNRLETLRPVTIHLRRGDTHRYPVLGLLFRLPDLRPAPRSVLLNYLHSNLDLFQAETVCSSSSDTREPPCPAPSADPHARPKQETSAPRTETSDSSPSFDAGFFYPPAHREDLFDRFLSWIAALVS